MSGKETRCEEAKKQRAPSPRFPMPPLLSPTPPLALESHRSLLSLSQVYSPLYRIKLL